ncbi:hypothetical protein F2Q68_00039447 [Brassica cretica]|uniref:Uncharacterized protein n=1 Tax=Brassica cretica TaxID=69181 RepID=A0A8S9MK74_BRACR|nr:hypothetical protein F2Q68_00039447 [Brassica cretica]
MKFSQLVGILKAGEMESGGDQTRKDKGIAFSAEKEEDKIQDTAEQKRISELELRVSRLADLLNKEEEKNISLEVSLSDNYKRIRMLNTGMKELDKILNIGQPPNVSMGLGYCGE